jgi:RES domain
MTDDLRRKLNSKKNTFKLTFKMNKLVDINDYIIKILTDTYNEDELINPLASFCSFVEFIEDKEYQMIGISPNSLKEKLAKIFNSTRDIIENFNSGLIADSYSGLYKLLFEENNNSLLLEHKVEANTFFFRLRKSNIDYLFSEEEMFHIPFEMRHKIGNQRYSISGYPCLYLGSSIYGSWEELQRPPINTANIVGIKNITPLKLLDVRIPLKFEKENDILRAAFAIACSIKIKNPKDPFKPEYVIPQAFLHSLVKYNQNEITKGSRGIHGIIYRSTHIHNRSTVYSDHELFDNIVIPVVNREGKNSGFCETLCEEFLISQPTSLNSYNLTKDTCSVFIGNGNVSTSLEIYNNSIFGCLEQKIRAEFSETNSEDMNFHMTRYTKISKGSIPERFRKKLSDRINNN